MDWGADTSIAGRRRGLAAVALVTCALTWPAVASADAALRLGVEGPRVAALQRAFGIEASGVFDEPLRAAVMRLQRARGLTADGTVGPATWGLLERIRARARRRTAAQPPPPGMAPAAAERRAPAVSARPAPAAAADPAPAASPRPSASAPTASREQSMSRHSGALAPGWGSTLGAALRGSSSKAIVARALREALRASRREALVAIAAAPATAEQPRHVVRETASDQRPRLRIGQLVAGGHRPELAMPSPVLRVIAAADRIATMPYRYGGGHGNFDDSGYDCSGSVSYALHGGGLLDVTLASGAFMSWGEPGPGRWITIYAAPGHMFMVVAGRRFDTSGRGQTGSRWQPKTRGAEAGYVVRHPAGL